MPKIKSYSLALEIDRNLQLSLNNGQFEELTNFIDGYEDFNKLKENLKLATRGDILSILSQLRMK